jgi:hypothetical protein|tara:strand:+ start:106 stop:1110 length:1005 start_codon:yes stop_codon:yes gene_type:complete
MNLHIKIKFSDRTIEKDIDYPRERKVKIEFNNVNDPITVDQITLNGIKANPYYNTQFQIENSNTVISSAHTINKNGVYVLTLDDLYVRSHRSNTWHCSTIEEDFIFTYEFTRSSFVDTYRDRDHIGFDNTFIPCVGCSFTYGADQPVTATWPYLLAQKTKRNFLNLGIASAGVDAVYNNLHLLYKQKPFDQCVILVPPLSRRIVSAKIDDLYFRVCSNVVLEDNNSDFQFYKNKEFLKQMAIVQKQIIEDTSYEYSNKFFHKITDFCSENKIDLYCSAWLDDEYDYLKTKSGFTLLPKFPGLKMFKERADDNQHPHKKHYEYFVDSILKSNQLK